MWMNIRVYRGFHCPRGGVQSLFPVEVLYWGLQTSILKGSVNIFESFNLKINVQSYVTVI